MAADLGAVARVRRAEYLAYEQQTPPPRFETRGPVYHRGARVVSEPEPPHLESGSILRGIGCYPGVVQARVRLLRSPRDELSLDGKILVAVRTDPGWAPLFPTASGLLIERGSTLSHSAVVARELGIPTIVGLKDLTRWLADGEWVRMDGSAGTVESLAGSALSSTEADQ